MSMAACLAPMGVVTSLANADTNVVSSRTRPGGVLCRLRLPSPPLGVCGVSGSQVHRRAISGPQCAASYAAAAAGSCPSPATAAAAQRQAALPTWVPHLMRVVGAAAAFAAWYSLASAMRVAAGGPLFASLGLAAAAAPANEGEIESRDPKPGARPLRCPGRSSPLNV